jgi:hypothetical protein
MFLFQKTILVSSLILYVNSRCTTMVAVYIHHVYTSLCYCWWIPLSKDITSQASTTRTWHTSASAIHSLSFERLNHSIS